MASSSTTPEKSKKHSDKDLDLSNAARGVWLVKVPKYIAERWETAAGGSEVGKMKIVRRAKQPPLVTLSMDDALTPAMPDANLTQKTAIPKDHKVIMQSVAMQSLAVFSHTAGDPSVPTPDKLALEGKVAQKADCRPISNNVYMDLKKQSILQAIEPTRKAKALKNPVNTYKPVANHAANLEFENRKKKEGKKMRDDKDAVMEVLFALFEKHQYYKINDLVKYTKQPVTYLKEILKDVCTYNMKNPHKNMWELKPEYRHYKKEEPKEEANDDDDSSDDD